MDKPSKGELIGLLGALVALLGAVATIMVPEFREFLGLETSHQPVRIVDGRHPPTPSPTPRVTPTASHMRRAMPTASSVTPRPSPTSPVYNTNDRVTPPQKSPKEQLTRQLNLKEVSKTKTANATFTIKSMAQTQDGTEGHLSMLCQISQCQLLAITGDAEQIARRAFIIDDQGRRFECVEDLTNYPGTRGATILLVEGEALVLDLVFRSIAPDSRTSKIHYDDQGMNIYVVIPVEFVGKT